MAGVNLFKILGNLSVPGCSSPHPPPGKKWVGVGVGVVGGRLRYYRRGLLIFFKNSYCLVVMIDYDLRASDYPAILSC